MQMIDVFVPTTDGRELSLPRYTQPDPELKLLLKKLYLTLPHPATTENHRRSSCHHNAIVCRPIEVTRLFDQ